MTYAIPNTEKKSISLNNVEHSVVYYKPPTVLTGVDDETYPEYVDSESQVYNLGDWVKIEALKKKFRCKENNISLKHPLEFPEYWTDFGPLKSFCMLSTDNDINQRTYGNDIYMEFDFSRSNVFAIVDVDFISVTITQIDNSITDPEEQIVFQKTFSGRKFGVDSFVEYCFLPFKLLSRLVVTSLKWLPDSTLKVQFSGAVYIGGAVYGVKRQNGNIALPIELQLKDNSQVSTSEITGNRSVYRYGITTVVPAELTIPSGDFNVSVNKTKEIMGKNILLIPSPKEKLAELISLCYLEDAAYKVDGKEDIDVPVNFVGVL